MFIPEPKFYLKDRNTKIPTLIYMQAKYSADKQERFMLSTGNKILPDEWDDIKQRAIISKRVVGNSDLNLWLDKMATAFKTVFRSFLLDGKIPSATELRDRTEEVLNIKVVAASTKIKITSLIEFTKKFIEEYKSLRAPNTIKSYVSTCTRIKEYETWCGKQFQFEDITIEWRAGFIKFLQSCGNTKNTEGKHIKNVKLFMNEATERGLNTNMAFKSKNFSKPSEDVYKIFLTMNEIYKIANLDLTSDKAKDIVRDFFVIACQSSLRYSDFTRIRKENIKGDYLQMVTTKTGQEVIIPISPSVRSIFEKYNYEMPKAPCNQVFNRCLKEIGKQAELNEKVAITKTVAGVKKTEIKEKWELLSSHVGRRSLVSNCIMEGINTSSIMLISGHKSLRVFQGYVRVNQQQNAEVLSKHPFFQK
ncbi:site-specific integrase [Pinibacter aurantiacus]|uniref:Site-specific integrase n=1 Tax=Pinibacter aurantiacus TaxID=2851599 RepID=A0A9E2S7A6_9BACT|nr:site-specific integrase [Pinibacter aurantiacus]MBV4356293.1 site-specific integrase [Pinibacter aurantiacus]